MRSSSCKPSWLNLKRSSAGKHEPCIIAHNKITWICSWGCCKVTKSGKIHISPSIPSCSLSTTSRPHIRRHRRPDMGSMRCEPGILCRSVIYAGSFPQNQVTDMHRVASLPLLRPALRSCGGIFTYLRSNERSVGPSNYDNPNSASTFGSAPKTRCSRP